MSKQFVLHGILKFSFFFHGFSIWRRKRKGFALGEGGKWWITWAVEERAKKNSHYENLQ